MDLWRANGTEHIDRAALAGRPCFAGLDLASTSDFTAFVLLFPGSPEDATAPGFTVVPRFWIPRAAVEARPDMRDTFDAWERQGVLTVTSGDTVDYERVMADINQDAEAFDIRHLGYDPWNALQLVQRLEEHGMSAVKVPQTVTRLNEPCKILEALLVDKAFRHGGNPVMAWMANNVELVFKGDGLMKPKRTRKSDKIDGIAAALNAIAVSLVPDVADDDVTFYSFNEPDSSSVGGSWLDGDDEEESW